MKKCDRHESNLAYVEAIKKLNDKLLGKSRQLNGKKFRYVRQSFRACAYELEEAAISLSSDRFDTLTKEEINDIRANRIDDIFKALDDLKTPLHSMWRLTTADTNSMADWIDKIDAVAKICNGLYQDESRKRKIGEHYIRGVVFKDGRNIPHIKFLNEFCDLTYTRMQHAKDRENDPYNVGIIYIVDYAWQEVATANSIRTENIGGLERRQYHFDNAINKLRHIEYKIYRASRILGLSDKTTDQWVASYNKAFGTLESIKKSEKKDLQRMEKNAKRRQKRQEEKLKDESKDE